MVFKNGQESPMVEDRDTLMKYELATASKTINIRNSEDVREVSMLVSNGTWYGGIRMYNGDGELLIDEEWMESKENTDWSSLMPIPEG